MVERDLRPVLERAAGQFPVVVLVGPRQSGKSTLCRAVFHTKPYTNLEAPDVRQFAADDPRGFLAQFPEGAVLDEIQRVPELMSYLQVEVDSNPGPGRWILTGSQNLLVMSRVSQSLAGRSAVLRLLPLSRPEVERFPEYPRDLDTTLLTGGYPRILDARVDPAAWLSSYVATYIERDVRELAAVGDLAAFQRFVQLCAGRTATLVNFSALAADAGVSQPTAKAWLGILEASFIVHLVAPWHRNAGKRLVKAAKLHFIDTGIACWLLGIRTAEQLRSHPLRGAMFESWVVGECLKQREARGEKAGLYFYRDSHQLEVDVLLEDPEGFTLIEVKSGATIATEMLAPLKKVAAELGAERQPRLLAVTGSDEGQRRSDVGVVPWRKIATELGR